MELKKVYFVSGIDTDAGKSYATGAIAAMWRGRGCSVITQKFIQTGCGDRIDEVSEDIAMHRRIMGTGLLPEDIDHVTCPLRFGYPASPDLAARLDNRSIDLSLIGQGTDRLLETYDTVLIEGAGGLMVPVFEDYTTLDYVQEHSLSLILVTNPRLGSVNHTLLSLEICISRGVQVDMLAYNHWPVTSDIITNDTREVLLRYLAKHLPHCEFIEIPFMKL